MNKDTLLEQVADAMGHYGYDWGDVFSINGVPIGIRIEESNLDDTWDEWMYTHSESDARTAPVYVDLKSKMVVSAYRESFDEWAAETDADTKPFGVEEWFVTESEALEYAQENHGTIIHYDRRYFWYQPENNTSIEVLRADGVLLWNGKGAKSSLQAMDALDDVYLVTRIPVGVLTKPIPDGNGQPLAKTIADCFEAMVLPYEDTHYDDGRLVSREIYPSTSTPPYFYLSWLPEPQSREEWIAQIETTRQTFEAADGFGINWSYLYITLWLNHPVNPFYDEIEEDGAPNNHFNFENVGPEAFVVEVGYIPSRPSLVHEAIADTLAYALPLWATALATHYRSVALEFSKPSLS